MQYSTACRMKTKGLARGRHGSEGGGPQAGERGSSSSVVVVGVDDAIRLLPKRHDFPVL